MPGFKLSIKRRAPAFALAIFALSLVVNSSLWSRQSSTAGLTAYTRAVQLSEPAKRLVAMEQFFLAEPASSLVQDALECVTWDSIRLGDTARSARWGSELLRRSPTSPLAQAALASSMPPKSAEGIEALRTALTSLDRIHKPEGFSEAEFAEMRRRVWLLLDGSIGLAYVGLQQYEDARPYLKLAVSVAPNDPRYSYSYALALLSGKNPDTKNGYWHLARAVNLNAGSPAGTRIAQYARSKYLADGGSDADWKQFVAVTSMGTRNQKRAMADYAGPPASTMTAKTEAGSVPGLPPKAQPSMAETPRLKLPPRTDPVSLGILLQTSLLKGENRKAIVGTLRDLVGHLRPDDEAFLMAYSDQLDFQQDLTRQDMLLDDALEHMTAGSGAALFEGISFAVGHLDRIGKNRNRVLLVISDGRNTKQAENAPPLSSQIRDVRIDCIGLDALGQNQSLLQRLARYSGGRAAFVSDPEEFRGATLQLAQAIGIDFSQ